VGVGSSGFRMEANFDLYFCCVKMGEEEKERIYDLLMIRMDFVGNTILIMQYSSYCIVL
jgi:hypothetical protein